MIFDETRSPAALREVAPSAQAALESDKAIETIVRGLEDELQHIKDRLRATIEEHELSVEELKASNEELLAMNEELRSTGEELETGKEELQSVNEELTTVNQELKETIDEVGRANTDLRNLISSTDIATIFLDRDLRVKRYTPRTQELFNLIKTDIGRPLEHVTHKLDYGSLTADLAEVLETSQPIEREVRTSNNHWYMVRVFPYRTLQEHIDGVVATFVDITERRHMEHAVREADRRKDEFLALLSHELRNPLQVLRGVFDIQNRSDNPERIARIWSMAERQADQLHRLVDDLLQCFAHLPGEARPAQATSQSGVGGEFGVGKQPPGLGRSRTYADRYTAA